MSARNKRQKSPDVDAIEEDEKQYGSGPLSLEELNEQYATLASFPHSPLDSPVMAIHFHLRFR